MIQTVNRLVAGIDHRGEGAEALVQGLRHSVLHQLTSELAERWHPIAGIGNRFGQMRTHDRTGAGAVEGSAASQQVVEGGTETVDITTAIQLFTTHLFRAHI